MERLTEFVDKLVERLEEKKDQYTDDCFVQKIMAMEDAIEITQKLKKEYNNGWIPCSQKMPEEHDSMFAKLKGTDKWNNAMFEKVSDVVNVTVVDKKGKAATVHAYTVDGKWTCDLLKYNKLLKITHWQPLPEPFNQETNINDENKDVKFIDLFGLKFKKLDDWFEENEWKLVKVEADGYQVFFGEGVQVDNLYEYGLPYLYNKEMLLGFAEEKLEKLNS